MKIYLIDLALLLQFAIFPCDSVNLVTFVHQTCRNTIYPQSNINRFAVPDHLVDWKVEYPEYLPKFYESSRLANKPYVDPALDAIDFHPKWNSIDGNVDRTTFHDDYEIRTNYPLNVAGRTGISGRGEMKRWGVNHAADAIVTRWKRNIDGTIVKNTVSGKNIMQMVAIQRRDNLMWAIPGGKVDPGEKAIEALKREFIEEAMNYRKVPEIEKFFNQSGTKIYSGYVDDPRNTDNAWFETTAYNFHDESGDIFKNVHFEAGDDAGNVKWLDVHQSIELFASHKNIVSDVVKRLNAHW